MPVKGNDRADRLAVKATTSRGLHLGTPQVLRSLRCSLWAQSQGHLPIDRLQERGLKRGSVRRSSLKVREGALVDQTNTETEQKATLGHLPVDRQEGRGSEREHNDFPCEDEK